MSASAYYLDKLQSVTSFRDFCLGKAIPDAPIEVFFEISNVCDLKCAMCGEFSALSPHRREGLRAKKRGFIEEGTILDRFDPILRRALLVHCFGYGEPTIHPDFRKILDYVSRYEVMIDFFTNGMNLDADLCAFLVDRGIYKVTVSFSGLTKDVYEAIYVGGKYERVLAGLRRIAELKKARDTPYPIVEINSLAFKEHVATFEPFVEMMAGHGVNIIHLKQLQPPGTAPQVHEHISIMRPWVEGRIVARAIETGKRLGVQVSADQYLRLGVATETEYARRMADIEAGTKGRLGNRSFGDNPLTAFAEIAASTAPHPGVPATPPRSHALTLGEDKVVVHALLDTREPPAMEGRNGAFHCIEPFKTLYVTRNGGVKPCCFGNPWAWQLGDAGRSEPMDIWAGVGYQAVREGIVAGQYPMDLCGRCLALRLGPEDNYTHHLIHDYLTWHRSRFGTTFRDALAHRAPGALTDIAGSRARRVAARHRNASAELQEDAADGRALHARLPDAPMLDHTLSAVIEGNLERLGEEVVGWVWSPLEPAARLPVSIWREGRLIARTEASLMRGDLVRAGKGDGAHGFHIILPLDDEEVRRSVTVTIGDAPDRLRFPVPAA